MAASFIYSLILHILHFVHPCHFVCVLEVKVQEPRSIFFKGEDVESLRLAVCDRNARKQ